MPSSFFLAKSAKKRKPSAAKSKPAKKLVKGKKFGAGDGLKAAKRRKDEDEEILSDGSDIEGDPDAGYLSSDNEQDKESAEEKRLRLAKLYLQEIERQEKERFDEQDETPDLHDAISKRLKTDNLQESGKLRLQIASNYQTEGLVVDTKLFRDHKVHKSSVTCNAISKDGEVLITGSKDGGLVWWKIDLEPVVALTRLARVAGGRKGHQDKYQGHCGSVNAVAVSTDGKFFASGDDLNLIHIWTLDTTSGLSLDKAATKVHTFRGHRSPVSGLTFRKGTHNLYSCSHDRSVKSWNLDEMSYVETLFGHQDKITGIDAGLRERAITSGGRDGSIRVWKIVEESQLVFNAPSIASGNVASGAGSTTTGSVDAVKLIDEEHFATCGEDGHLSLWSVMKKKPLYTIKNAHGVDETNDEPRWITGLASQHNTDLVVSGSQDGHVRLWKSDGQQRRLTQVADVDLTSTDCDSNEPGFVNSIAIHPSGKALILSIGQEHRLGRWWRHAKAKNGILVVSLNPKSE